MKVFVYSKKTSKKIATIKNVVLIQAVPGDGRIQIVIDDGEIFQFDTGNVKTTIYQN